MPVFRDAVSDTTTTTGTGTITLAGSTAVAGTRTISSAHSNADTLYYRIENSDNTEWEVGLGTYTSSGTTLSRDTILASSNSGSAVNFSAGTKNVYTVIPASFRARGTITANDPFEYTQTWNAGGVTFTALRVNVTNTASATASMLADFQVGGSTVLNVTRNAVMTLTGPSSTPARIVSASPFRAAGLSVGFNFSSGTGVAIEDSAGSSYVGGNASGFVVLSTGYYGFTSSTLSASVDTMLYRDAANTLAQRNGTNAQTFNLYDTYASSTDYHRFAIKTARATLASVSGASVTAAGLIPDGAIVVGVTSKVTVALGTGSGTTGYQIGDGTDPDRWGAIVGTAAGTSSDNTNWTATTVQAFTSATDVVVTASGGNFNGTGTIYLSVQYLIGQCD